MQKAVVVVTDSPQYFGAIKAQLGVVTAAWFAQRDFTDVDILQRFSESLPTLLKNQEGEADHYFGISLREMIHEFKWQTLVLFKCALLQPKVRRFHHARPASDLLDAFLRLALRALVHDAVCFDLSDTRPGPPPSRFCRSQV